LRIPFALSRAGAAAQREKSDTTLIESSPAPRRLLILGGPTLYWKLDKTDVLEALSYLLDAATTQGGSVVVVGSPRTNDDVLHAVEHAAAGSPGVARMVPEDGPPSYPALLAAADTIFVTADSVAMVSDAILTGKPVGLLPIRPTVLGRAYMRLADRLRPGRRVFPRDLRYFWAALDERGLVGTLEQPRSGMVPDLTAMVAERVRGLLRAG